MKWPTIENWNRVQRSTWSYCLVQVCTLLLIHSGCTRETVEQDRMAAPVSAPSELFLPEAERAFLWECEHRSNLIGTKSFSALTEALSLGDLQQLSANLAADFVGVPISNPPDERYVGDNLSLRRAVLAQDNSMQLGPSEFAEWLVAQRHESDSRPKVGVALLSYAPAQRDRLDEEWLGRAKLRITNRDSESANERVIEFEFSTPGFSDSPPATGWLSTWKTIQIDSGSVEAPLMQEVAADRGLAPDLFMDNWTCASHLRSLNAGGLYLADFDRDGRTDILLTEPRSLQSMTLYRGIEDGRFENKTRDMRLPLTTGADHVAIIDLDDDGWEDVVLLGLAVFKNADGKHFIDATLGSNLDDLIEARGLEGISGASVADFDRDGLTGLYVTRADSSNFKSGSWIDGKSGHEANNQLLRNLGRGKFEDVTVEAKASGGERSAFASTWFDANDDGWPDLYVIHEFGAGGLLLNQQNGTFVEQQIATNSDDFGSMGLASGDVDNDGNIDIYVSNMYSKAGNRVMDNLSDEFYDGVTMSKLRRMVAGSQLHLNNGEGSFSQIPNRADIAAVGWGWGVALADLNNDGFLDIYATCGFMSQDRTKPDG